MSSGVEGHPWQAVANREGTITFYGMSSAVLDQFAARAFAFWLMAHTGGGEAA